MKPLALISLCLLFTLSAFSDLGKKYDSVFLEISKNVKSEGQAFQNLQKAIAISEHRLTGSDNGRKAEEFAFKTLKSIGYSNARYLPFEMKAWARNSVKLSIVPQNSDNFLDLASVTLAHSPIVANTSARIIDCGDGLAEDFELVKDVLKDKVALFNIDIRAKRNAGKSNLHRSEKAAIAIKHGASAIIIINKVKGEVLLTGTASVTGKLIPIPAVCISLESGRAIRRWIRDEKNILAQIDMSNFYKPIQARNVSALHKGKSIKEKIVIAGHLDSWDLAQGAIDNGIGAFSVIDIARVFKDLNLKTKRSIEFVLFMGEEQGLLGSKHYLAEAEKNNELANIALMINLDMLNNAQGFNSMGNKKLKNLIEKTGAQIKAIDANYENQNSNQAGLHSDHQGFMTSGIPVCLPKGKLSQQALDCYHADCDDFSLVNEDELNNNVKYTAMMLYALANAKKLPKRLTSEETRDFLISQNLKDELILGESWTWGE